MIKHRLARARTTAGLSLGQAAKLLGIERADLEAIEARPIIDRDDQAARMADVYGVRVEWLTGEAELRDYEAMKNARGYDTLCQHDRDIVAEFAASMPRDSRSFAERVADIQKAQRK